MTVRASPIDDRVDDPDFVLCLALTYLGLPPGIWRIVVNHMLESASAEYRDRLGEERGSREFNEWKALFEGWSRFNKFKAIIVFLGESKVGLITITNATARAVRARILARLAAMGVREGAILGASQIVRKVTIYLEIAWISGCATFCAATVAVNAAAEFARGVASALQAAGEVADAIGAAVRQVIARPILVGRAMLDPSNWDTSPMGSGALVLRLLEGAIWSQLGADVPNTFLANLSRPVSSFNPPRAAIDEIAVAMTQAVNARGGLQAAVSFTSELILGLTPLAFAQLLVDWRLLRFIRDPQQIATEALGG